MERLTPPGDPGRRGEGVLPAAPAALPGPAVSLEGIWKAFTGESVLRGLELEVPRRHTVKVMGGSGSGKTVLLRLTAGLIKPDRGRIRTLGEDITPLREEALLPIRRQMGFVFQGAALFDSLTVYENVAYPLREHANLSEDEVAERVHRLLARVDSRTTSMPAAGGAVGRHAEAGGHRRASCSPRSWCSTTSPPPALTPPTRGSSRNSSKP